jgi:hypothetical protein
MNGAKLEARFFHKGEPFPNSRLFAPKQGVWARPVPLDWDKAFFLAVSWRFVELEPAIKYLPNIRP